MQSNYNIFKNAEPNVFQETAMTQMTSNSVQVQILSQLLNVAELMLACGAEVNRVEDTISRIGTAYGAAQINVFVITSSAVITIVFPGHEPITQTRRLHGSGQTNFYKLEKINALSRACCRAPMPIDRFAAELEEISTLQSHPLLQYLGSILAAGSFCIFFGGTLADGIASACFAILLCLFQSRFSRYLSNPVAANLVYSFLIGACICLLTRMLPFLNMDLIMIGDIMLLIPGIAMTNALRDIFAGDTISGLMRFIEALLIAGTLAFGFMASIWLIGGR